MRLSIGFPSLFTVPRGSRLTFSWVDRLLQTGRNKDLSENDVDDVSPLYRSNNVDNEFTSCWESEIRYKQPNCHPSLTRALFKSFGRLFLLAQCCRFIQFLFAWNSPAILSRLITYLDDGTTGSYGLALTLAFFFNQVGFSVFIEHSFHNCNLLGLKVRTAMYTAIFKKSLSISTKARQKYSLGEMISLLSENTTQLGEYVNHVSIVLLSPLHVIVMLYQLFTLLGIGAVFGMIATVLLVPVNLIMTKKQERLEEKLLRKRDQRMKFLTEILNGIKTVKLNVWERCFGERLMSYREEELEVIRQIFNVRVLSVIAWTVAPYMISVITFASYVCITGNVLDAKTAFIAITYLNILRYGMNETSDVFFFIIKINLHLKRIKAFLLEEEYKYCSEKNITTTSIADTAVEIKNGTFTWNNKTPTPTLSSIDTFIPRGSLTAVVGPVGSGKSSLISAILGEIEKTEGDMNVKGTIAYVPQEAWIQNATLQDNILFGHQLQNVWYEEVLEACALNPDLDLFPGRDQVEIGEKGINLSGGQQQRLSLARAVYNDADIYLLDDPLSAVDSHVGKYIFRNVIGNEGLLKDKTRVFVTHNLSVLSKVDQILVVKKGSVVQKGTFTQLMSGHGYLKHLSNDTKDNEPSDRVKEPHSDDGLQPSLSVPVQSKLISDEETKIGRISMEVYKLYLRALGVVPCLAILTLYIMYHCVYICGNIWLRNWTEDPLLRSTSSGPTGGVSVDSTDRWTRTVYYLTGYTLLGVLQAVLIVTYSLTQGHVLVSAARTLHKDLLENILRSPMSFFDSTPIGRITTRFSTDLAKLDSELAMSIDDCLSCLCNVVGGLFMISYISPTAFAIIIPMFFAFVKYQRSYVRTSRQLRRLSAKSKSPVTSFFTESVAGTIIIRAFRSRDMFTRTCKIKIDNSIKMDFYSHLCDRWLGLRMSFLGNVVLSSAISMLCGGGGAVTGGNVGLTVSFSTEVGSELIWLIINSTRLDLHSISVERILQYISSPKEMQVSNNALPPPSGWPKQGTIEFRDFDLRYRPGLDLVLKNINFKVKPGEKIGIVGRTGAGKSSLILSLFRVTEPSEGAIFVDDLDISRIGLQELRSKMAIIPQDPVLFTGSLRLNLDPESQSSKQALWRALEHTGLKEMVEALPARLQSECGEGGHNLSVGQRQLLCLTRTLLKKSKILVLDEATAAVDMATDDVIQETIRREFQHCTVLTIAHRIRTVLDYDRILVLDKGSIEDFDSPSRLLDRKSGIFYELANSAGAL